MNQDVTHSKHSSHLQLATTAEKHHVTTDYPESDVYGTKVEIEWEAGASVFTLLGNVTHTHDRSHRGKYPYFSQCQTSITWNHSPVKCFISFVCIRRYIL